jgi:hypothetical protein
MNDHHLRTILLEALGLDNTRCDLGIAALIQKVATERTDLVQPWGDSDGRSGLCLNIAEENGDVCVVRLS